MRPAEATTDQEKCYQCNGSGRYCWGPVVNGKTTHSGVCFRCRGKGHLTPEDKKRNRYYDAHVRRVHL